MERPIVFVTGATGLLGCNTVHALLNTGYRVRALARDKQKAERVLPKGEDVEIVLGDLERFAEWKGQLAGASTVVHCAAYFREYFGRGGHDRKLQQLNVELPVEIVGEALRQGVGRCIVVSSTGALSGNRDGRPANEQDAAEGQLAHNGYQQSKVGMEKALGKLGLSARELVLVRPGWMFGPNDYAPTATGQIALDIRKQRKFQFMDGPPFGIVDARDVAFGIAALVGLESPKPIYHLAGANLSPLFAIQEIAKVLGKPVQVVPLGMAKVLSRILEPATRLLGMRNPLPYEGIEVLTTNFKVDSSLAERELGVLFRPFQETAEDLVSFIGRAFPV